jgi:hypothetical protein
MLAMLLEVGGARTGKNRVVHHNIIEAASTQHLHNIDNADLVPSPNDIS